MIKEYIASNKINFLINREKININAGWVMSVDFLKKTIRLGSQFNPDITFIASVQGETISKLNKNFFKKLEDYLFSEKLRLRKP